MKILSFCFTLVFLLLMSAADADEVRPAYLAMQETSPDSFAVLWKYPVSTNNLKALQVVLPDGCEILGDKNQWQDEAYAIGRWNMRCLSGLFNKPIEVTGLDSSSTELLLRIEFLDNNTLVQRLTPLRNRVIVPEHPTIKGIITSYFVTGIEHILTGTDHLLFVLCVMLLLKSNKRLLLAITTFTVAHSMTLIAATLGYVSLNPTIVEILIALSIVFLAYEVMRDHKGIFGISARYPWIVIFVFGLMHGLGFAGALDELGLPQNDIPLALLFFNLGVEAGQVLFIVCVLLLLWSLRKLFKKRLVGWRPFPAYAIGIAASFWFFQRLTSLWS